MFPWVGLELFEIPKSTTVVEEKIKKGTKSTGTSLVTSTEHEAHSGEALSTSLVPRQEGPSTAASHSHLVPSMQACSMGPMGSSGFASLTGPMGSSGFASLTIVVEEALPEDVLDELALKVGHGFRMMGGRNHVTKS